MREKLKRLTKSQIVAALLAIALIGTVTATIMYTWNTQNSMHIVSDYTIRVTLNGNDWTTHDWENFLVNEEKSVQVVIWNEGNIDIYVSWNVQSLPTGWEIRLRWKSTITDWVKGTTQIIQKNDNAQITVYLKLASDLAIGDYSFTLLFNSHDVA